MSPRPPPKISLRHDWTKGLGSKVARQPEGEVARQPEGEVARQAKFFQPTQPIYRVLMSLPCVVQVSCTTWYTQSQSFQDPYDFCL